jgi:hypothetical protein
MPVDPRIRVKITSPADAQLLTGNGPGVTVSGLATFQGLPSPQLVDVRIGADGPWLRATGTTSWTVSGEVPGNGTVFIYARATVGELIGETSIFVVCELSDVVAPSLTIAAPAAGSTVSGDGETLPVTVAVDAADDFLGIASVTWSVDGFGRAFERFATPLRTWSGVRTIDLDTSAFTSRTITVTAADVAGNARSAEVVVTVADCTAPALTVWQPADGATVPWPGTGQPIRLDGVAIDRESGVRSVEVSVNGGVFTTVTRPLGLSGDWHAEVVAPPGRCTLAVRCTDQAGNQRAVTSAFELAQPYVPAEAGELFTRRAYLADLLSFASTHLLDGHDRPLTADTLAQTFHQPFDRLVDARVVAAGAPVNQLRAAIEVLRRFLHSPGAGLVVELPFDEGAGTTTGGATIDGATWTQGRAGGPALLFDGVDDIVRVPAGLAAEVANTFTIAFWALPLSPRATDTEATTGTSGTTGQRFAFGPQQAGMAYGSPDHAGVGVSIGTDGVNVYEHSDGYLPAALVHDAPITGWTHVAVIYSLAPHDPFTGDPGGWYPELYLNGVRVRSGRVSPKPYLHCVPDGIGASAAGYGAFHGRLDDVRVYDRLLDTTELMALYREREIAASADYAFQAYRVLLSRIGTSYEEIRLARGAAAETRRLLAERLGIDLIPGRPDRLDQLLLSPDAATEADLARLFGMMDTRADPLAPVADPLLLVWRLAHTRRLWAGADATQLVVDPDLLVPADLRHRVPGDPAFDLLTARRQWTDGAFAAIRADREAHAGDPATEAFDEVVSTVLMAPVRRLAELEDKRRHAVVIDAELAALRLTPAELQYLLRLREVTSSGIVAEDEWTDLYHLLTQVRKRQQREAWLAAETTVVLTPEEFTVSDGWSPLRWRGSVSDRLAWQDRLQSRVEQEEMIRQALATAVADVEQRTLPSLRDALVSFVQWFLTEPDRLSAQLLVDVAGAGVDETTRVAQAVESLQQLLLLLRAGRLPDRHPARSWRIEPGSVASFDDEWAWLGSYDAWRAAMFVFTFPEDLLSPTLRAGSNGPTAAFQALLTRLRGLPRLRRPAALTAAREFLLLVRPLLEGFPVDPLTNAGADVRDELLRFDYTDRPANAQLGQLRNLSMRALGHLGVGHPGAPNYLQELFYYVPLLLAQGLQRAGDFLAALDWFRTIYVIDQVDLPDIFWPVDERKIYYGLQVEYNTPVPLSRGSHWLRDDLNPHVLAAGRGNPYTRYTFGAIARCFLEYGDAEFTRDTGESRARARALYLTAQDLLGSPDLATVGGPGAITSPVLTALRESVRNQLRKLRRGRNIAGMQRPPEEPPPALPGVPAVDASGRFVPPGSTVLRPTPYRFAVLLDRSRQLVATANQIEASYLAGLEKRDVAAYDRQRAGFDLDLARSTEHLQTLRITEARNATELARRQKAVNDVRATRYQEWIDDGPNVWERALVSDYDQARYYRDWLTGVEAGLTTAQAIISAASCGIAAPAAASASATIGVLSIARAAYAMNLNSTEEDIQLHTLRTAQERRQDEWELQLALANADALVAEQAILDSQQHEEAIGQEAQIAGIQTLHAQSAADFLARKFTNLELYEWMTGVLAEVYGYFLQQATGTALLAQQQLAFERQQSPPVFVQADYWQAPADETATPGAETDRRGLTGSVRLMRDLEQLSQFAFEADRRKLNLSQAFSLSEAAPYEFQAFRDTGVLTFETRLTDFDRMFPGDYLRLIRRVRVSVVALVPPVSGIRATFTASGISRVVIGPQVFQETVIRRDPEFVGLTSPANASGVFDLDLQSDMLLPFESMGVATRWELRLPRPANEFDFRSIADVVLTIDYTALHNADYRTQVIQRLDPRVNAQRAYSFRDDFPDVWYELNNPDQSATPMVVRFDTRRADFPPNLEPGSLAISQLLLYLSPKAGTAEPVAVAVEHLTLTPAAGGAAIPSSSSAALSTPEGVISTRAGNWNWLGATAKPVPVDGTWDLAFAAGTAERFARGDIRDILFVVTYTARTPAWPEA